MNILQLEIKLKHLTLYARYAQGVRYVPASGPRPRTQAQGTLAWGTKVYITDCQWNGIQCSCRGNNPNRRFGHPACIVGVAVSMHVDFDVAASWPRVSRLPHTSSIWIYYNASGYNYNFWAKFPIVYFFLMKQVVVAAFKMWINVYRFSRLWRPLQISQRHRYKWAVHSTIT